MGTHQDLKKIKSVELVLKAPKGDGVVKVTLNWKQDDAEGAKLVQAVARSLAKTE